MIIHTDIKPFKCFLRREYLYDMNENESGAENVTVFAVSCYPGYVPTFQVLVNNSDIFSYLPANALFHSEIHPTKTNLNELNYINCPSKNFTLNYHKYLVGKNCFIWSRNKEIVGKGKYILTLDWPNENLNVHLIKSDDGNFMFWPSHKLGFDCSKPQQLPNYKKLRREWKI